MDFSSPLSVVTPTLDGPVLAILASAEDRFTVSQLHRMLDRSEEGIRLVLSRLAELGVVERERVGASHAYRLNRDHLAAPAITALADQRGLLLRRLEIELGRSSMSIIWAAVFGSVGRGSARSDSDLDLLIVHQEPGDEDQLDREIADLAAAVTRWTGNDTRPLVYTASEVRATPDEPVLQEALRDGLTVAGHRKDLQRILKAGLAPT